MKTPSTKKSLYGAKQLYTEEELNKLSKASDYAMSYDLRLASYLKEGWVMTSEGASGAQLRRPICGGTKACLIIGILTCWLGIGFIFLFIGIIGVLTSGAKKFVAR